MTSLVDVQDDDVAEVGIGNPRGRREPAGSWDQTCARTFARATSIFLVIAGVTSSRARHTVGADATEPSTSLWWRSTSMSAMASLPPAINTATSTRTRPRAWVGVNPRRDIAPDRAPVRPTLSARSRVPTAPDGPRPQPRPRRLSTPWTTTGTTGLPGSRGWSFDAPCVQTSPLIVPLCASPAGCLPPEPADL